MADIFFLSDDIEVARTVKLPPLPTKTTAYANTFRVRYLDEVGESFRQRIPEKNRYEKAGKMDACYSYVSDTA